jgi:hypothetical protein
VFIEARPLRSLHELTIEYPGLTEALQFAQEQADALLPSLLGPFISKAPAKRRSFVFPHATPSARQEVSTVNGLVATQ